MATDKGVVYGLHAFVAENEDEISFAPGEEVIVLEKDDQYGDGWWQGRNKAGAEGLFPVSYTSPTPPVPGVDAAAGLPHPNDPSFNSLPTDPNPQIHLSSPSGSARSLPRTGSQSPLRRSSSSSTDNANAGLERPGSGMIHSPSVALNKNIESAINQLSVNDTPSGNGTAPGLGQRRGSARSRELSMYADSINDDERGPRDSIIGGTGDHLDAGGEDYDEVGWSANTRKNLAEKAINENRKRELREQEMANERREREELDRQTFGMPAGVEFSDESEDEDETHLPQNIVTARRRSSLEEPAAVAAQQIPVVPAVPLDQVLSANGDAMLPSTLHQGDNEYDRTRRRASVPVEPLVISKNTPPTSSPSSVINRDLPSSTPTSAEPSLGERAIRAAELASVEPSALAKEPSPYHTIVPDQAETTTIPHLPIHHPSPPQQQQQHLALANPTQQQRRSPSPQHLVASPVASSPIVQQHPSTSNDLNLAPPLDLETLPSRSEANTPLASGQLPITTNIIHSPAPGRATSPAVITPVNQSSVDPFDRQNFSTHTSAASPRPPSTSSDSVAPPGHALRQRSSFSQGMGACGIPGDPMDWSVEEVVDWAKKRGFDESVWSKFQEHEITGDVLLELDLNLLKEIDIIAFGKRMKLASAISELRPNSTPQSSHFTPGPSSYSGYNNMPAHGRTTSVRSGAGSQASAGPQSPTFGNEGPNSSYTFGGGQSMLGNGSASGLGGGAGRQVSMMTTDSYYGPMGGSSEVGGAEVEGLPAGVERVGDFGEMPVGESPMNGRDERIVGLGLNGQEDNKSKPLPLSLDLSPKTASTPISPHGRKPSVDHKFNGASIAEEPIEHELASPAAIPASSSPRASPIPPATASRTDVGDFGSLPPSPASASSASVPKRASVGHKKGKGSVDEKTGGSKIGNFLTGSRNGRKPAPRMSTGSTQPGSPADPTSPTFSSSAGNRASKTSASPSTASTSFRRSSKANTDGGALAGKRMSVAEANSGVAAPGQQQGGNPSAKRALDRIPEPDFAGYLRKKGERYNSWKTRYCVLSGPHLYYLKSENDAKFKGYIFMQGYKVLADESASAGNYGFKIVHDKEAPHSFSLQEPGLVRDWMKALMKATISRDYSTPVVSSCNIPTMTLKEAQSMSPAPRPPSPSERAATQRASRRENPNQLTARDASVLMGLGQGEGNSSSNPSSPTSPSYPTSPASAPRRASLTPSTDPRGSFSQPPRPSRELRRPSGPNVPKAAVMTSMATIPAGDATNASTVNEGSLENIAWVNEHLPAGFPKVETNPESFRSGLALVRLVENVMHEDSGIPLTAFVVKSKQEHEDLLIRVFDFFIDCGVEMDGLHSDDVVLGNAAGIDRIIEAIRRRSQSV